MVCASWNRALGARNPNRVQRSALTFDPVLLAARAKGRLQHAMRTAGVPFDGFSRKVALRSVGDNTTADVEGYIARQVAKERFADSRFAAEIAEFTAGCPEVDLRQPSASLSGRYWYNLHVVLVVAGRDGIADRATLAAIRDGSLRIAAKKGHAVARLSAMPDHLHIALRGNIKDSPQEIALSFQNNLAYLLGQKHIWNHGFYVGTFSEYDFGAIRAAVRREARAVAVNLIHLPASWQGSASSRPGD